MNKTIQLLVGSIVQCLLRKLIKKMARLTRRAPCYARGEPFRVTSRVPFRLPLIVSLTAACQAEAYFSNAPVVEMDVEGNEGQSLAGDRSQQLT